MNDQDFKDMVKSSLDRIERQASENNARLEKRIDFLEKRIDSIDAQTKELKEDQVALKISQARMEQKLDDFLVIRGERWKVIGIVGSLLIGIAALVKSFFFN